MKEIFKDIPNYEGLYQVSNKGRVKNLDYYGRIKLMDCGLNEKGYLQCCLSKNKIKKTWKVHQLVAIAFLNHTPNGHKIVVDHVDNNSLNNNVCNLQLITNRENLSKDKKGGSSKYIGVSWDKKTKNWKSQISINHKKIFLGNFNCEEKAAEAYQNKLKEINNEKN